MFRFILAFLPAALFAQAPVRLDDLIREALSNNPEIAAAQKGYEAARQKPSQEGALPDPMLSFQYNSVGRPWPGAGIGVDPVANAGAMVSQMVPFPGKRDLRRDIAAREAGAARSDYDRVVLDVTSRVKQAFYRLAQAYASIDVLERNRDVLRRFLRISEARYSVGRGMQQDIFKTQAQLSIFETRIERARQEIRAREAELNALLDRAPGSALGRPVESPAAPLKVSLDDILKRLPAEAPMLAREQKMAQRAELAANLARRELFPDFTVSAGVYSMGSMGQMYMGRVDFTLPLWAGRKQRAAIAEQVAATSQARRSYEAAAQTLGARVREDYAMAETSLKLLDVYRNTVIPQSNLALESSLASYETGAVDLLTVLSNFGTTLEYEMNIVDERLNYLLAVARIEGMTGIDPTR